MRGLSAAMDLAGRLGQPTDALLRVGLDGFTCVQASLGDAAADRLLEQAGGRIADCLASGDLMAPAGMDEFHVLIACRGDASAASRMAELILRMLSAPYPVEARQVAITACVGLALVRPEHAAPDDVVRDALEALHRAKSAGPAHCAMFDAGMHEATIDQLRMAAECAWRSSGASFASTISRSSIAAQASSRRSRRCFAGSIRRGVCCWPANSCRRSPVEGRWARSGDGSSAKSFVTRSSCGFSPDVRSRSA